MKNNRKKTKKKPASMRAILSIGLSLSVILYLGYQIFSINYDVLKTESAIDYTYYHTTPLQGFFVRDEVIISNNVSGVVGYCQPSGSKVASGQIVARAFETNEQAAMQTEIDEIDVQLKGLEGIQIEGAQLTASAEVLDSRINNSINQLQNITDQGHTQGLTKVSNDLVQLLNKKQVALGTAGNFNAYIETLKARKTTLLSQLGPAGIPITVDQGGYFINSPDGYENILKVENLKNLTCADIEKALETEPVESDGVGKLVASSEWYVAATIEQDLSKYVKKDDWVEITVPLVSDEVYRCRVEALISSHNENKAVLVLCCSQMNSEIAKARNEKIQLRMNTYHGLRVNQSAIRVVDGITGVYVVDG
ncbi:MAG: hypothetical protein IKU10_00100, partial [Clostridia bacterium]|nr:hypothetical protein [Clostridia bacterium]